MNTTALVDFLQELRANNTKEWFAANRARYDALRAEFQTAVAAVIDACAKFDDTVAGLDAGDAMFRINRDVRFSKDKSPYKTSFSAMLVQGKKSLDHPACYYFHIDADDDLLIAAGMYLPSSTVLARLRKYIAEEHASLTAILNTAAVKDNFGGLGGERLKTVPREYGAEHPAAEYLKHKGFIVSSTEQASMFAGDSLVSHVVERFHAAAPFVHYLRKAAAE